MSAGNFRLAAITGTDIRPGEAEAITRLLERGWWRVHIRKPGAPSDAVEALINDIPAHLRERLSLHDHFHLAPRLGVGGLHLNMRHQSPISGWRGMLSQSCHSVEEVLANRGKLDYMFLSPVFDSISKPGYAGKFSPEELAASGLLGPDLFALGGVIPRELWRLGRAGFGGAAMLSAAWQPAVDPGETMLQFITDRVDGLEETLRGGCRWVQLRMKDASDEEFTSVALAVGRLCRKYRAKFILDDRVRLVGPLDADGVHLGKNDMPLADARSLLGPALIIGATANTPSEAIAAAKAGADYLGVGPFRFTTTKKLLAPLLGAEGIADVVAATRAAGSDIPIVAIGGITPDDLREVRATGVNGVAVSGIIQNAPDKRLTTKEILTIWKN